MIYQWKLPGVIPVAAQAAGEELERIYEKHNGLSAKNIVDESRDEQAPLHPCFEWNDAAAAEKYREVQAQNIIRSIIAVREKGNEPLEVRAFVHVQESYRPISVVVNSEDQMGELLRAALSELNAFKRKYASLSSLQPVFEAINLIPA